MAYVDNTREGGLMISPENGLSGRLEHMADSEQARLQTLTALGLLETESVPVFEEATQTAAHFLEASICVLGVLDRHRLWYKSAVGLSRLGLMNSLASTRQIDRTESFCAQVVETQQVLAIADAATHPAFAANALVQRYGVRAYLGVPLITSNGTCVGTLAIMELEPRSFTRKEIDFLQLMARWSMSEFERDRPTRPHCRKRPRVYQSQPHFPHDPRALHTAHVDLGHGQRFEPRHLRHLNRKAAGICWNYSQQRTVFAVVGE
jgi:GAF domain-containing protein